MTQAQRSSLVGGLVLIGLGALFLVYQVSPAFRETLALAFTWPLIVVGVGVCLFVLALMAGAPDMAVPACIVSGVGALLHWQNATGNWESWAYAWTLIPGFAGVGVMLAGLLAGRPARRMREGLGLLFISLLGFALFASVLGGFNPLGPYWPALLILAGVVILLWPVLRRL